MTRSEIRTAISTSTDESEIQNLRSRAAGEYRRNGLAGNWDTAGQWGEIRDFATTRLREVSAPRRRAEDIARNRHFTRPL